MSGGQKFDAQTSRKVEALYLTPDVVAQRCRVLQALEVRAGERVIDIGCGPGLLAFDLAASVGPSGRVSGVDTSTDMLALAGARCAEQPWASFEPGDAVALPYPDHSFDAAVSTQVYEFIADVPAALAELHRVICPGGRAVIVDTDYDSLVIHTEDPVRMERVLAAWDGHFLHAGLPRTLSAMLREAGFNIRQRDVIPMFNPEYHDHTYARGLLEMMASYAASTRGVSQQEADSWLAEFTELGRQGRFFFSLNRYLFVADKPAATGWAETGS